MYADNNDLQMGDTHLMSGTKYLDRLQVWWHLSDYSCLFQNNNDSMFDAVKFGVGLW